MEKPLAPWEQHSSVIPIPRFDYKAPNSILEQPHSGFLITCDINREKSATKEVISILEKHMVHSNNDSGSSELIVVQSEKKRKLYSEEIEQECKPFSNEKDASNTKETCVKSDEEENVIRKTNLSLVKLMKKGLLLFIYPCDHRQNSVDILTKILNSLEHGDLKPPHWCHRIFPIQETFILNENSLFNVVSKLVQMHLSNGVKNPEKPIKFAVGYDRKGLDTIAKKTSKITFVNETNVLDLLGRNECFKIVAKAVKHVAVESVVDLTSPELIVLIELLPISGVQSNSTVAGVSVLTREFVTTKPRLCVKSLSLVGLDKKAIDATILQ
ncbi:hypothetical protein ZOSMA_16G00910 [Zostera marina]|uniref:THUMP domain-containing protein n=1 Tax=Zostera marina TaxID=29655 RepID=A0A0K9PT53_ZOSMR|nr:hypothetical protein ZOSMA_16G00910 [Zostera marina]